jgi:serine/threonine protein kinase
MDLVGKTLGSYLLVEMIGTGGLATVYKALQPELERWVAIKVLHYKERKALIRFQREAQAIARLRHGNIVIVYGYGEEGSWPYIVMEYVEGGTLADRLSGKPMDWVNVINLAISIGEALAYAHGQGVIHRDVKPSNILMPQEDWPLLADFGLVKLVDSDVSVTGAGISIGTPAYVAPEQARGEEVDHRSDIYSLGVVLFEMVTGRWPFDYPNPNKILLAHMNEPVPSPHELNPECPSGLEHVILTAMEKSAADRYASMQGMVDALKDVLASSAERPAFYASAPPSSLRTLTKPVQEALEMPEAAAKKPLPGPKPAPSWDTRLFLPDQKITLRLPNRDELIIGRTHLDTVVDLDLGPYGAAKAGISRRHARLFKEDGRWLIDDMGSLNGTYVNNVKITPGEAVALKDGDSIRCSHMSLVFLAAEG